MSSKNKTNTYQYGNTIRFECSFYDFDNEKVDPDIVKMIIYNYKYEILHEVCLTQNDRSDVGDYIYDYPTDKKEQKLYYEWYGKINGKPALRRGEFMTKFI